MILCPIKDISDMSFGVFLMGVGGGGFRLANAGSEYTINLKPIYLGAPYDSNVSYMNSDFFLKQLYLTITALVNSIYYSM